MKRNRKNFSRMGFPIKIAMCVGFGFGCMAVTSMALSFIALMCRDPSSMTAPLSLLGLILSAVLSGVFSSQSSMGRGKLFTLFCSALTAMLMLLLGLIICGRVQASGLMNCLCYVAVATAFSFIKRPTRRKHAHR